MTVRGTHRKVMSFLAESIDLNRPGFRALDLGAGEGALSVRLKEAGLLVDACDQDPGIFQVDGVECWGISESGQLPYDDGLFDVVLAVEVVEHLDGHRMFFQETARVLKPGGTLIFTTPNILSLKSRLIFLFGGYYHSFGPLEQGVVDPVSQHISPFTLNRYQWMLSSSGFRFLRVATDKWQSLSLAFSFLVPLIKLVSFIEGYRKQKVPSQNSADLLFGRKLFLAAERVDGHGIAFARERSEESDGLD